MQAIPLGAKCAFVVVSPEPTQSSHALCTGLDISRTPPTRSQCPSYAHDPTLNCLEASHPNLTRSAQTYDSKMADPSTTEEVPRAKSPDPVDSIEVVAEIKDEEPADEKSDNEADAHEDEAGGERPVSNDQYKALKSITDILTNYKVKVKGDE